MRSKLKSFTSALLIFILISGTLELHKDNHVAAAEKYITVEQFAQLIAEELDLSSTTDTENSGYVNALLEKGIIKEGDFTSYKKNITRGDALVIINRADEYLYGDKLEEKLIQTVIDKRISDINKVKEEKRVDVAKAYIKGFMKGYSNGAYCTDRKLKVTSKLTKAGAESIIKMLKNKKLRAKISPDGQLIRTTNLPKYAKYYPYILESFPNSYYDWQFCYEGVTAYDENGKPYKFKKYSEYAAPIDVSKTTKYENFDTLKKENLDTWVDKARSYMEHIFSVDYKSIDEEWIEGVIDTHFYKGVNTQEDVLRNKLEQFVSDVKKYKTVIEYDTIAIDGSTLYFFNGDYYLRTYVKYRIVSTDVPSEIDIDELTKNKWHNKLLFTIDWADIRGFKEGQWREGHFDISLHDMLTADGKNIGVCSVEFIDGLYKYGKVD